MNIKFVAKFTILLTVLLISNIDVASASSDNKIRVTFKKDANTAALTRILECAPAKGNYSNSAAICKKLLKITDPFKKPAVDEICSEIFGGESSAKVVGKWRGKKVNQIYSLNNGCEIARWKNLEFLFY